MKNETQTTSANLRSKESAKAAISAKLNGPDGFANPIERKALRAKYGILQDSIDDYYNGLRPASFTIPVV